MQVNMLITVVPCNQVNNCDINADCLYDPNTATYTCKCRLGYEGDGFSCRLTGPCSTLLDLPGINHQFTHYLNLQLTAGETNPFVMTMHLVFLEVLTMFASATLDSVVMDTAVLVSLRGSSILPSTHTMGSYYPWFFAALGDTTSYLLYSQGDSILQVPFRPTKDSPGKRLYHNSGQSKLSLKPMHYVWYASDLHAFNLLDRR